MIYRTAFPEMGGLYAKSLPQKRGAKDTAAIPNAKPKHYL